MQISHLSTFVVLNPDVTNLIAAIDELTVTRADAATQRKLAEIQTGYAALTSVNKTQATNYDALQSKSAAFDSLLAAAQTASKAELNSYVTLLRQSDYTAENWLKLQRLLSTALADVTAAKHTDGINSVVTTAKTGIANVPKGSDMTVPSGSSAIPNTITASPDTAGMSPGSPPPPTG